MCYKIWKCSVLFSGPWFTGSVKRLSLLFLRFLPILPWLNTADVVTLELLKIILKCSLKIDVVLFYLSFKSWNWCSKVAQCGIFDSIKDLCYIHFLNVHCGLFFLYFIPPFTKHSKVLYVINVQIRDLQVIRKQNF